MLLGLILVFTGNQVRADRAACDEIKAACKNAGFVLGGGARDGLLVACFQPIVQGTAQPKSASRPLPAIDPQVVNACREGKDAAPVAAPVKAPLVPAADGQTVYDPSLNVTWLADANLAGKQTFGVSNVNKSGSMDYATAVRWVAAMNQFDHGAGYLGHHNWQLPTAPSHRQELRTYGTERRIVRVPLFGQRAGISVLWFVGSSRAEHRRSHTRQ